MRNSNKTKSQHNTQTLWHLSGQRTGDGDKSVFSAAVVNRHLLPLAIVSTVAIALVTELIQTVASVHQHSWSHWLVAKIIEMRQIRAVLVMKYFLDLSIKYFQYSSLHSIPYPHPESSSINCSCFPIFSKGPSIVSQKSSRNQP